MAKSRKPVWGDSFEFEPQGQQSWWDQDDAEDNDAQDEALELLDDAHSAINRLYSRANVRGRDKMPRRTSDWQ